MVEIENGLMNFTWTARQLGVHVATVRDLARHLGIVPKPMSHGQCKGLDAADRRKIRKALRLPAPPRGGAVVKSA